MVGASGLEPLFPTPPYFVFRLTKYTTKIKGITLVPPAHTRSNEQEFRKICLLKFILFGSIKIHIINLYTIILPKLYLYDK